LKRKAEEIQSAPCFGDKYAEATNKCIGVQMILANLLSPMQDLKPHWQEAFQTRMGQGVMKFSSGCCVLI